MRNQILTLMTLILLFSNTNINAQAPAAFKYQAVARDTSGQVLVNQPVIIGVALLQGSETGTIVFSETHLDTTNGFGLVNLEVGIVDTTGFKAIDWNAGPYFLQVSVDGNIMGTSQLLSVPYAQHASTADSLATGGHWESEGNHIHNTNSDNVGIGANLPLMKLHVLSSDSAVALFENSQALNSDVSNAMYFKTGTGSYPYTGAIKTIGTGNFFARLGLFTYASPTPNGLLERLTITDNGNVGIGTTTPSNKLSVNGDADFTGNVGIGITSPYAKLHVAGGIKSFNAGGLQLEGGQGNNTDWTISRRDKVANSFMLFRYSNVLGEDSTVGTVMTIRDDGWVGIGTTDMDAKLHIGGLAGVDGIMFPDGTLQTTANSGGASLWTLNGSNIYYNTGKVGIGTNNPINNLHIYTPEGSQETSIGLTTAVEDGVEIDARITSRNISPSFRELEFQNNIENAQGPTDLFTFVDYIWLKLMRITPNGDMYVHGNISKAAGSFKIDHPVDPANKLLYHSAVQSPDMMNVYNGVVTTDANGFATVEMPSYFEALNSDFRYQLTAMGGFAQLCIYQEIENNQFVIRSSESHVKVSWQVTGIRQDAFANKNRIPTEEDKTGDDIGKYLHPEAFDLPVDMIMPSVTSGDKK